MAFAIASGLTPQAGIYCAIVTGFLISALGGSRFQIGGPTGAFVVVVSGIITRYGVDGLFMCTMMAGVLLAIMGLTGTGAAMVLGLNVETIGSRFGGIPSGLPNFQVPMFRPGLILTLISPAFTVAMLGAIESLLSAVVADRMGGDRHNPNTELFAQGIANIVSPLFGGLPATGVLARTTTNIRSGARSPVSGMIHAVTLLGVLLFGARYAAFVPLPVLAAILFIVAWNMGEWGEIWKHTYADILVWLATFLLTMLADLTVAVEVGMGMAALLFIRRISATTTVSRVTLEYVEAGRAHVLQDKVIPDYVAIFRIHGPFLFGSTDKLHDIAAQAESLPPVVILRLRNMTAVDGTGLSAIEELAEDLRAKGRTLVICGAPAQPAGALRKAEFHERLGEANICSSVQTALDRAAEIISTPRT